MERQDSPDNIDLSSLFGTQPLFEPDWARTPPKNPYAGREDIPGDSFRSGRDDRFGRDRRGPRREEGRSGGFRRDGDRPPRRDGERKPFRRDGDRPAGGFRHDGERKPFRDGERKPFRDGERRPFRRDGEKRPPAEPLHLKFSFFPDRTTLATISENIRATGRVFSLVALAKLFLSHGNSYSVKIERLAEAEPRPGRKDAAKPAAEAAPEAPAAAEAADGGAAKPAAPGAPTLCQCLVCKRVFRSLPKAEAHAFTAHLEEFFDVEKVETPQPATPVACVARCGMTGELLGPPNSHAYTARLHEIWKTKFPNMLWTDYLSRVQVLRDEESIEKWKEQARFRTVYRLKAEAPKKAAEKAADGAAEAAPAAEEAPAETAEAAAPAAGAREEMTRAQAEEWTRAHRRSQLLRISSRCILTGAQSGEIDDPAIRNAFAREKAREERFPLTLLLALRTALKRMRLHIFKLGGKETFVSAVEPKHFALDALDGGEKRVVESILSPADGKATRRGVLAALAPEKAEDSPEALAILGTIRKLTQAGNVLLFEDGTLKALVRAEPPKPAEKPAETSENAEKPAEEVEKAPETAAKAPELPAPAELWNDDTALQAEIDAILAKTAGILEKIAGIVGQAEEKPAENAPETPENAVETAGNAPEPAEKPAEGAAEPPQAEENA
jgi:hypothetical protein